jgi:hypothetical protein
VELDGQAVERQATVINVVDCHHEAERKMGQMLAQTERNKGAKPGKTGHKALPLLDDAAPTLAEIGVTKRESA